MDIEKLKTKTILYVEDDEAIMRSFSKILNKVFKDVITAIDGQEGLEAFKSNQERIDFVITDIKMPKMDGLEMAGHIKEINDDIPCILTTAHGEFDYFVQADLIGIYRYIQKPLNINELFQAIHDFDPSVKIEKGAIANSL